MDGIPGATALGSVSPRWTDSGLVCALVDEQEFGRLCEVNIMQAVAGKISTFVTRVFGCWHGELSRPFSRGGRAYRKCLSCGAQRQFNLGNWEMQGKFFYTN
jgi:hypothetical protein